MKKFFCLFFILWLFACSGKNENLVDLDSFENQGRKIYLRNEESLQNKDIDLLKKINIYKFLNYSEWNQSNQNSKNLIYPSRLIFLNQKKKISTKINSLIIYNNKIFSIDNKSNINVYDLSLKKIKSKKIYKKKTYKNYNIKFSLLAHNKKLFISDNLGNIHCLTTEDFKVLWRKEFTVPFRSNMKIYGNDIFLINSNSKLFSINTVSGKLNWSYQTSSNEFKDNKSYQIAIFQKYLIFTNDSSEIFCLDLEKKNIVWSLIFNNNSFSNTPIFFKSSPITVDNDGSIYISTTNGTTYSIQVENGKVKWASPLTFINRFLITEKYLLNIRENRFVILNKQNGSILFNKSIENNDKNQKFNFKDIILGLKYIYLFDTNGYLITVNKNDLNKMTIKKNSKKFQDFVIFNEDVFINTANSIIKY